MALANWEEANRPLDQTKIKFTDDQDALPEATDTEVYIKAALKETFPDNVASWGIESGETAPPVLVRLIAAMLMAAQRYEKKYSEEALGESDFASRLRSRAEKMLEDIRAGILIVTELPTTGIEWDNAWFWPNDDTIVLTKTPLTADEGQPDRKFTMGQEF